MNPVLFSCLHKLLFLIDGKKWIVGIQTYVFQSITVSEYLLAHFPQGFWQIDSIKMLTIGEGIISNLR